MKSRQSKRNAAPLCCFAFENSIVLSNSVSMANYFCNMKSVAAHSQFVRSILAEIASCLDCQSRVEGAEGLARQAIKVNARAASERTNENSSGCGRSGREESFAHSDVHYRSSISFSSNYNLLLLAR